jgi:hypothetical protein
MNCLNGYFHFPYFDSLAEELVKAAGKGAIASFSPSGLSLNDQAHHYHKAMLEEIFSGRHERLGDALTAAQSAYPGATDYLSLVWRPGPHFTLRAVISSGRSPPRLAPRPRSSRGLSAELPRVPAALRSGVTRFFRSAVLRSSPGTSDSFEGAPKRTILPAGDPEGPLQASAAAIEAHRQMGSGTLTYER